MLRAKQQQQLQAQLQRERMEQQLMMEAMQAKMKREQAAERAGGMGGASAGRAGGGRTQAMSKKDKAKLEKAQKEREKQMKKAQENRQKAFKNAQKAAARGGGKPAYGMGGGRPASRGAMASKPDRGGVVGFVLSPKGLALLGGVGFMYLQQRPLLMKLTSVPLMLVSAVLKKGWALLLRPLIRRLLVMRSASKGPAAVGGELPGGSY